VAAASAKVGGELPIAALSVDHVTGSLANEDPFPEEDWGTAVFTVCLRIVPRS